MNIAKAIYYNSLSPEQMSDLIIDIVKGFEDAGVRKLNFFDLFIIIPFYSYLPAQKQFERITFKKINSFQRDVERSPNTFSNIEFRYMKSIHYIKLGILYSLNSGVIQMDSDMNIVLCKEYKLKEKTIFNIGKVFSSKRTSHLYNFFGVNINAI